MVFVRLNPLKSGEVPEQKAMIGGAPYFSLNPLKSGEVPEPIGKLWMAKINTS